MRNVTALEYVPASKGQQAVAANWVHERELCFTTFRNIVKVNRLTERREAICAVKELDAAAAARSTCICCACANISNVCSVVSRHQSAQHPVVQFCKDPQALLGLQRIKRCLHGLGGEISEGNLPEADVVGSSQIWGLESCIRWHSSVSGHVHTFRYTQRRCALCCIASHCPVL